MRWFIWYFIGSILNEPSAISTALPHARRPTDQYIPRSFIVCPETASLRCRYNIYWLCWSLAHCVHCAEVLRTAIDTLQPFERFSSGHMKWTLIISLESSQSMNTARLGERLIGWHLSLTINRRRLCRVINAVRCTRSISLDRWTIVLW